VDNHILPGVSVDQNHIMSILCRLSIQCRRIVSIVLNSSVFWRTKH